MKSFNKYMVIIALLFLIINSFNSAQSIRNKQIVMFGKSDDSNNEEFNKDSSEKKLNTNYNKSEKERQELLTALRKVFIKKRYETTTRKQDNTKPILKTEIKIKNGKKTVVITRGVAKKKDISNKLFISLEKELNK